MISKHPHARAPRATQQGAPAPTKHDEAHRNAISRLSKERAAETARLAAELAEARGAAEAARRQYAGATSRRKVLEEEVCGRHYYYHYWGGWPGWPGLAGLARAA